MDDPYYCEAALKTKGWTAAMIKEFKLKPVWKLRNPHFPRAGRMKLYRKDNVHHIESTKQFKERMALKRKRGAKLKGWHQEQAEKIRAETPAYVPKPGTVVYEMLKSMGRITDEPSDEAQAGSPQPS